jgi:hypothetical protein
MKHPSEKLLAQAERELRRLGPGAERAVGGGVYMRLDRSDERKRRFTYRGVAGRPGGTADSWREAYDAREALKRAGAVPDIDPLLLSRQAQRLLPFKTYTLGVYLPDAVLGGLEISTRADYFPKLERDVFPLIGHHSLAELEEKPGLVIRFKEQLAERKRFPQGHRRGGELPEAACNAAIKVASSVCDHAWRKDVIGRNPFRGINRFNRRRTPGGEGAGSYRRVEVGDLMEPAVMAAVGVGMRGDPVQLLQRRLKPLPIVIGMRPQVIDGAPWRVFRDEHGPTRYITASDAVKDIAGHLMLGQPKTGTHTLYQFDSVARLLARLYELQGRPPLDRVALPNVRGGYQDQGNWRGHVWYKALHRAGIAASPDPSAVGAFEPYTLRPWARPRCFLPPATTAPPAATHEPRSPASSPTAPERLTASTTTCPTTRTRSPERRWTKSSPPPYARCGERCPATGITRRFFSPPTRRPNSLASP